MNETQWKYRLQYARDHYPPGTRVRLLAMPDDPQPIPPGTTGTVMGVDDAGQLLMLARQEERQGLICILKCMVSIQYDKKPYFMTSDSTYRSKGL